MTEQLPLLERKAQDVEEWLRGDLKGEHAVGPYRYLLWRRWNFKLPRLVIVMLNPSKANAFILDPTVRRCISFAQANGFGAITVINLYAWRATDPKELLTAADPVGVKNDEAIRLKVHGRTVLVAWGAPKTKAASARSIEVARMIANSKPERVVCLGTTKDGHPRHPLYVRGDQELVTWPTA